jgi:putative ABC transport system ATP-binding protein
VQSPIVIERGGGRDEAAASPPAAPLLEAHGLVQRFDGRVVLEIPAWSVMPGEHCLVLGPSGCGKSTLLHLIAGLLRPSAGRIAIAGRDLAALRGSEMDALRGRRIGIVLQSLHLIGALTAEGNLRLARSLAGLPPDPGRIEALLAGLGIADLAAVRPARMSQGERQRLAIARAVVNRPELVLADEPTSALDDANCEAVLDLLLRQADAAGATLVIATHDARLAPRFRHRLQLPARP